MRRQQPFETFDDQDKAMSLMRVRNAGFVIGLGHRLSVVVEGPCDGEWTVMSMRDAVDNCFSYTWETGR